ncbi:MAG: extensin [Anaerolineales bacterium]|nr:extensin [Anaerolineae bacterium]PWB74825.1 MAG: extensin [Anaerolineales bacterium]
MARINSIPPPEGRVPSPAWADRLSVPSPHRAPRYRGRCDTQRKYRM